MITCRCGAPLGPSATGCPRCGARPLGRPQARHQAPQHQATHHQAPQHQARHLPQPGPRAVPQSAVATMVRPVPVRTAPPVAAPFVPPPPAPAPSGGTPAWMGWTVAVAGLLVVGLLAAVAVLVLRPTTVTVAAPAPVTTTRTVVPSAPADDTVSGYRSGSTDTEATSAALLAEGVEADRASVESLVGS